MAPTIYYAEMNVDITAEAFEPEWDDAQTYWKLVGRRRLNNKMQKFKVRTLWLHKASTHTLNGGKRR